MRTLTIKCTVSELHQTITRHLTLLLLTAHDSNINKFSHLTMQAVVTDTNNRNHTPT